MKVLTTRSRTNIERFTTEDLAYYFDTVTKNRRIHDHHNYKQAEWNNLRNKLIRLPIDSFDATIDAIEKLVDEKMENLIAKKKASLNDQNRLNEGKKLYDSQ